MINGTRDRTGWFRQYQQELSRWGRIDWLMGATSMFALLVCATLVLQKILLSPSWVWSASRLSWTFSLLRGYQLYYPLHSGPVYPAAYGPLAAILYLPATLFKSPTPAIIAASFLSVCFYFLPVFWLHLGRAFGGGKEALSGFFSLAYFCLLTFFIPALIYSASRAYADTAALGLGALAAACLYYRKSATDNLAFFLSALFAIFSIWTKQSLLPILLALPGYLLLTGQQRYLKRYLTYLFLLGMIITVALLLIFNFKNMWFNMVIVPLHLPFKNNHDRLIVFATAVIELFQQALPLLIVLIAYISLQIFSSPTGPLRAKEWISAHRWVMFILISLCLVPVSIFGRMRIGGAINTQGPALYFLLISFTLALKEFVSNLTSYSKLTQTAAKIFLIVLIILLSWIQLPSLADIIKIARSLFDNHSQLAYSYARTHPGEVYFPTHPLTSLLVEGKLYHQAYAINERNSAGFPVSSGHFRSFLPERMQQVAFPKFLKRRGQYAMDYLAEFSQQITVKELPGWIVYVKP